MPKFSIRRTWWSFKSSKQSQTDTMQLECRLLLANDEFNPREWQIMDSHLLLWRWRGINKWKIDMPDSKAFIIEKAIGTLILLGSLWAATHTAEMRSSLTCKSYFVYLFYLSFPFSNISHVFHFPCPYKWTTFETVRSNCHSGHLNFSIHVSHWVGIWLISCESGRS